jgi:Carboxypeptidase regulatory-like domain
MADSAPLRKARLRLRSVDDPNRVIYAITNEEGRFALKGIEPGPYRLTVSRVGFVTEEYGQRKPNTGGAVLTLRPGQEIKDLLFRLSRSGVISGKIFDEDGEPLPSVTVECFRQVYSEGKRSRTTASRVETNDLGEYRLFGLPPGRYFISSLYPHWTRVGEDDDSPIGESQEEAYAKLFYPGTADVSKAGPVIVKPGDEISSTDILMTKVIVHRVRGHRRGGTYRAEVNGMSKDCYIKDVRYGESSVLKEGFTVTRGEPSTLEILISSRGARVEGTVRDADGLPLPGVPVVLIPELSRRENYQLYKSQSTDQYGHFDLRGIAPGDYV